MKTQNFSEVSGRVFGAASGSASLLFFLSACRVAILALKNYKENRENGSSDDNPQKNFPTKGFENLCIKDWSRQLDKWPDSDNRYWYNFILADGSTNTVFYYKVQNKFEDAKGNTCYLYIIGHYDGTQITGFYQKPNYDDGFPRSNGDYCYDVKFNDEHSLEIRKWMGHKDLNYLRRIKVENPELYQKEIANHLTHPPVRQLMMEAAVEEQQRLLMAGVNRRKQANAEPEKKRVKLAKQQQDDPKRELFSKQWPAVDAKDKGASQAVQVPASYCCPITHQIMIEPVITADENTYEREAILGYFDRVAGSSSQLLSPISGEPLDSTVIIRNNTIRSIIREFLEKNPSCWKEAYLPMCQSTEFRELASGRPEINAGRFTELLQREPRLLYMPLGENNPTLLQWLCDQNNQALTVYMPILFSLLKATDWKQLLAQQSVQTWLITLANACDKADILSQLRNYLPKFESMVAITLAPMSWAQFALESRQLSLFKLFVPLIQDIHEAVDDDGNTLLHEVAKRGLYQMVEVMVQSGGNLKQRNNAGLKPEAVARQSKQPATADSIAALKLTPALRQMGMFRRVDALEERNAALEQENQALRTRNEQLESRLQLLEQAIAPPASVPN